MSMIEPDGAGIELGVNIDHIATLRNARGTTYPDPLMAAMMAEEAGAGARPPVGEGSTLGPARRSAFAAAGLGDAVGDGAVRQNASDKKFFTLQETHSDLPFC